jgi:hypothetical protein
MEQKPKEDETKNGGCYCLQLIYLLRASYAPQRSVDPVDFQERRRPARSRQSTTETKESFFYVRGLGKPSPHPSPLWGMRECKHVANQGRVRRKILGCCRRKARNLHCVLGDRSLHGEAQREERKEIGRPKSPFPLPSALRYTLAGIPYWQHRDSEQREPQDNYAFNLIGSPMTAPWSPFS